MTPAPPDFRTDSLGECTIVSPLRATQFMDKSKPLLFRADIDELREVILLLGMNRRRSVGSRSDSRVRERELAAGDRRRAPFAIGALGRPTVGIQLGPIADARAALKASDR